MDYLEEVDGLVAQLRPVLAGHAPEVQSAALAECVSIWLAGHMVPGNRKETARLREQLLRNFTTWTRALIEPNAKAIGTWEC